MARAWTEEYYDIADHYFWSPERLGHRPDRDRKLKEPAEVMARLRRIEEPLNHILSIFFALAPSALPAELFEKYLGVACEEPLELVGRAANTSFGLKNATQPDFLFSAAQAFLCLEAKVGSKSSPEQVAKYALLIWAAQRERAADPTGLLFLSPRGWEGLFPGKPDTWQAVRQRAVAAIEARPTRAFRNLSSAQLDEVTAIVEGMPMAAMSFAAFDRFLVAWRSGRGEEGDVWGRLVDGVRHELAARGLVAEAPTRA